jgi:hypothetical protein
MITVAKDIKNTIIVPYDDVNRMINFCKDDYGNITRDFYDWYLNEKTAVFMVSGILIIDNIKDWKERSTVQFNFKDPDEVLFSSFAYKDQSEVCKWKFNRQVNLTMKDIEFDFDYMSITNFNKVEFGGRESGDKKVIEDIKQKALSNVMNTVSDDIKNFNRKGFRGKSEKEILDKAKREGLKEIVKLYAQGLTYFVYALMYYVSKQEPEVIETEFKPTEEDLIRVKAFYKYTGYVDLRENRIYKPTIERNPDDPVRDYNRHIQAWSVRGHYRRTKKGLIWIDPHIKGNGELEKRIYGTEDEADLNLIPKVFEVERNVKQNTEENVLLKSEWNTKPFKQPEPIQEIIKEELKPKREHFLIRILRLFGFKK